VWAQSLSLAWGGDLVETFTDAMQQLAKAAILAAAALAKMLGLEGFVEGMKRALGGERKGAAGFAAPQDARVQSDIQAFARQMAEAAATATRAGAETKSKEEMWQQEVKELLAAGPAAINKALKELEEGLKARLTELLAKTTWDAAKEAFRLHPVMAAGRAAYALGRPIGLTGNSEG
jgi:hypothetical protein